MTLMENTCNILLVSVQPSGRRLVKWDHIWLAVRNLKLFNEAILGKWLWCFGEERGIMEVSYCFEVWFWGGGLVYANVRQLYGVSLWKYIRRVWGQLSWHVKFDVGSGTRLKFWHDLWCGEAVLQETFPKLYPIPQVKDALVADHLQVRNDSVHWRLYFIRAVQDWELETISSFLDPLYSTKVKGNGEDTICWQPSLQKGFKVSSYYKILPRVVDSSFPW